MRLDTNQLDERLNAPVRAQQVLAALRLVDSADVMVNGLSVAGPSTATVSSKISSASAHPAQANRRICGLWVGTRRAASVTCRLRQFLSRPAGCTS